jgi:hypothetical protein
MKPFLFFVLLVVPFSLAAQNRTNVWELSYSNTIAYPNCEMKYLGGIMDTNQVVRSMSMFITNSSICDTNGNLLFYSNGLTIGNHNYDTLQNAENFNPGWATDFYEPDGMGINQSVLIIPYPNSMSRYYIFSESGEIIPNDIKPIHLSYSIIDMNLNSGLGGIVDTLKNKYAIEDTLNQGGLTAVKHANGRDWWVIFHEYDSNKYYKLLVTPNGLEGPFEQNIGVVISQDIVVQATFSPDGAKYCFSNAGGTFEYMQFNRCTGEFSHPVLGYSIDSLGFLGCSFSPSSRFLYLTTFFDIYQYDTWDENMISDAIHIATWDSFLNPIYQIPVLFSIQQIAPDNKIYISGWNGVEYLNVLNSPDSLGFDCDFEPHSYVLPQYNNSIPTFPNYDLGALDGSPCDTIVNIPTGLQPPNSASFRISPNPATTWLNIVYETSADGLFELFDINGKRVAATSLYHYFKNRLIDVSNLPAGVYLATVTQNGKQVWREKIIKS